MNKKLRSSPTVTTSLLALLIVTSVLVSQNTESKSRTVSQSRVSAQAKTLTFDAPFRTALVDLVYKGMLVAMPWLPFPSAAFELSGSSSQRPS